MNTNTIFKQLAIESLVKGKFQPRVQFDEEAILELANSIKTNGILQPIVVRPIAQSSLYEIVAGERRWRAAQKAGLTEVNCLVNTYTDQQAAAAAAIENLNRSDLNPIEEAQAYQTLIDNFHYSHEEVAATMGKSRTKITNSLRLLSLHKDVTKMLIRGNLSESHGKIIAGLPVHKQKAMAYKCNEKQLSVRQLEKLLKKKSTGKLLSKDNYEITNLERKISEHVGSPTKIVYQNGKGSLKIHFHNLDILDNILDKLNFKNN
jgi:ParB family chromosome partitioning protein